MNVDECMPNREQIDQHRRALIAELRSGKCVQTFGAIGQRPGFHCAVGLGAELAGDIAWIHYDPYARFRAWHGCEYELSSKLVQLNDGENTSHGVKRDGSYRSLRRRKSIRRNFMFIARYLEVLWFPPTIVLKGSDEWTRLVKNEVVA